MAAGADLDPHIVGANASRQETGTLSDEDHQWFVDRGPGDLVEHDRIPTLFVQGTVDTLFSLDEAITNYESSRPTASPRRCSGSAAATAPA